MLIEDATMQVSFLKDLVTLRDLASDFSFLCYLKQRDRLVDFINNKTLFPLRAEFHGYFEEPQLGDVLGEEPRDLALRRREAA